MIAFAYMYYYKIVYSFKTCGRTDKGTILVEVISKAKDPVFVTLSYV